MDYLIKNDSWKYLNPKTIKDKNSSIFLKKNTINGKILINDNKKRKILKIYNSGFSEGYYLGYILASVEFEKKKKKNIDFLKCNNLVLEKKILKRFEIFLDSFKYLIDSLNNKLAFRLFKIITKISKIFFIKNSKKDNEIILRKLNNIIKSFQHTLKNPVLHIHPDNCKIIKKKFGYLFKKYNWSIFEDRKLDKLSFIFYSEEGEINATVEKCWKRIYRLINFTSVIL